MFRFFFVLLILLLLPDLLIWWNYFRGQSGLWRTVLLVVPTVISVACMLLLIMQVRIGWLMQVAFILLICIAVPKLIFVIISLGGKLLAGGHLGAQTAFCNIGIIMAVIMALVQIYGSCFGWRRIEVNRVDLHMEQVPKAFKGYRVVQISDIHLGSYAGNTSFISKLVDSVNHCKPDMIVVTGDLVNSSSDEINPYIRVLNRLHAPDGVFSVMGNHDYCTYHPGLSIAEQKREVQRVVKAQRAMGWQVLLNEHKAVVRGADTLYVAGVENIGKPPFPKVGNLKKAMEGIPQEAFTILLSHDPWHWSHEVAVKTDIPLTLSGHTHALQMKVGNFSPAQWFMSEWGGVYRRGKQVLFVSTGIGGSVPYRLGAWPKIEVFTL